MHLPYWFWRVRFRTPHDGGETLVIAPHPAGAKQSVTASVETIVAYESVVPMERVSASIVTQQFDGYYPSVRTALDTGRKAIAGIRND